MPGKLAVAGYGDFPFSQMFAPSLTTVRLARYAIGRVAGEQILKRLADAPVEQRVIDLGFEVVVRAST